MDQLLRGIGKPHDFAVAEKGGAKKSLSMKKTMSVRFMMIGLIILATPARGDPREGDDEFSIP
jgi:hypothetical protein